MKCTRNPTHLYIITHSIARCFIYYIRSQRELPFVSVLPSGRGFGEEQSRSQSVSFGWTQQLCACDSLHWSSHRGLLDQVPGINGIAECPAVFHHCEHGGRLPLKKRNVLMWLFGSSGGSADQLHFGGAAAVGGVMSQQRNKADHCWHSWSLWVSSWEAFTAPLCHQSKHRFNVCALFFVGNSSATLVTTWSCTIPTESSLWVPWYPWSQRFVYAVFCPPCWCNRMVKCADTGLAVIRPGQSGSGHLSGWGSSRLWEWRLRDLHWGSGYDRAQWLPASGDQSPGWGLVPFWRSWWWTCLC